MKFSEAWLRSWFNPNLNTEELAHQLTMAGLEVGSIESAAPDFSHVVVGEVLSVRPHPNADRLNLCDVSIGSSSPKLSIVCGASNVASGLKVAVALVGAVLPKDFKIAARKVRGEPSEGMLCAAEELGLAESSDGIMELPVDAPVGEDFRVYLQLDDTCIDVELTPNRGDCLSIRGLARELAVLNDTAPNLPTYESPDVPHQSTFPVFIEALEACPVYLGRVIRHIGSGETPIEVKERLRRAGVRPINPVVDATQYAMLALGQPMHAFDLRELEDQVSVRFAQNHEKLTLLDGQEIELNTKSLVIDDAKGPIALAGVMGGLDSSVKTHTKEVFLECAVFDAIAMAGQARSYGLHTDASHRFERGVDYALCRQAMEYATQLICDWTGGKAGPVIEAAHHLEHWARSDIAFPVSQINRLLGFEWPLDWVADTLSRLGCSLNRSNDAVWQVTPPSFRFDITRDVDLIEELARGYGYHKLPERLPAVSLDAPSGEQEAVLSQQKLRSKLIAVGFQAVVNYSFIDPKWHSLFAAPHLEAPNTGAYALSNPIAEDLSVMRTTLWPGLLKNVVNNQNRQHYDLKLFEVGVCFLPAPDGMRMPQEENRVAGLISGGTRPLDWQGSASQADFFDLKGDVEQFLSHLSGRVRFVPGEHVALHPQQTADIFVDHHFAGRMGKLHPSLAKKLGVEGNVYLFELILKRIEGGKLPVFQEVSKFPAIERDIAMLFPKDLAVADITTEVSALAIEALQEISLFDVYVGQGVDPELKSLAFTLRFQHPDKTLKDAEIDARVDQVVKHLAGRWQAVLRN